MEDWTFHDLTTHVTTHTTTDNGLDRLDTALRLAARLAHQADALVDHFVTAARADGRSWTDIGVRLGVSRQAARQRFTSPGTPAPVLPAGVRLSPRLQACVTAAARHAQSGGAGEVGTDHLLAGLLTDGIGAAVLDKVGVTADAIAAAAARLFGPTRPVGTQPPPLSPEAVCAIEAAAHHALSAAADRQDVPVGTERLLLVLALDPGSRARRVLVDLGADIAMIKKELACHLSLHPPRARRLGRRRQARHPACAFCGAADTPARPLVHGPSVAICGTCAQRALENATARATL